MVAHKAADVVVLVPVADGEIGCEAEVDVVAVAVAVVGVAAFEVAVEVAEEAEADEVVEVAVEAEEDGGLAEEDDELDEELCEPDEEEEPDEDEEADEDGDFDDADAEAEGAGVAGGMPGASGPLGAFTGLSTGAGWPVSRANQVPVLTFTNTISFTGAGAGVTVTSVDGLKDGHGLPVYFTPPVASTGGVSGLPHAHRTRGTPLLSTSTAVPAWSTDW